MATALALGVAACQGLPGGGDQAVAAFPVGDNRIGEPCRVGQATGFESVPDTESRFNVRCGEWEQPSARIRRLVTPTPLADLAAAGAWRRELDNEAACSAPAPTRILGDLPALSLRCAIRRGGWQYDGLLTRVDDTAYLVDSIPAAMPVAVRGVAVLAGLQASVAAVDAGGPDSLYSAGDLQRFQSLLREAQYYNYTGNYPEAEKRYRQALETQQTASDRARQDVGYVLMHLALELSNQERFAEAETVFARAAEAIAYSLDPTDEARLTSYQAIHFANQRRYQRATQLASRASEMRLALARQFDIAQYASLADASEFNALVTAGGGQPLASNVGLVGRADTALGDVVQSRYIEAAMRIRMDELDAAADALDEADRILAVDPRAPRRWQPQIQYLRALIAERRGDLPAAERFLVDSVAQHRTLSTGFRNENQALFALGRVHGRQGRLDAALEVYRSAFANVRDQRSGIGFDDAAPYFDIALAKAAAEPARRQDLHEEMFAVAQTVRGSLTAQTIALAAARLASSEEAVGEAIRALQDARRERDTLRYQLAVAQADAATLQPQIDAMASRLGDLEGAVASLERTVQVAAPRYNQLVDAPVTVDTVYSALARSEALLQILVGDDRAFGFLVDADGIEAYPIDLTERDAREAVGILRAPFDIILGAPFDVGRAHALYETLAGPVRDRLARARHIVYVPSGPLLSLPLGLLIAEPPPQPFAGDYAALAWLATRHAITLSASVQSFISLRTVAQPSRATRPLVAFGDFMPNRDAEALAHGLGLPERCQPQMRMVADLEPLPGTRGELEAVARTLGASAADLHLGPRFTEPAIKAARLADYRVVYFATHAVLPVNFTCWSEPQLVASVAGGGAAAGDDGLIDTRDVLDLDLDADLVVLSACNTAAPGGESGGESLSGLARAFFYAGARSLIVSHWRIPDAPTQTLMSDVFAGLGGGGLSSAEAIRRAQAAMIADQRHQHPMNWAAFSLVGDGGRRLGGPGLAGLAGLDAGRAGTDASRVR